MAHTTKRRCTAADLRSQKAYLVSTVFILALVGSGLAGFVNTAVISWLSTGPLSGIPLKYAWVAGFTEEILKNLGPLILGFTIFQRRNPYSCVQEEDIGPFLGLMAGATFAIVEVYSKLLLYGNGEIDQVAFWLDDAWVAGMWFTIAMHLIVGLIGGYVVGKAFADGMPDRGEWISIIAVYPILIGIHGFLYNGWFVRVIPKILGGGA